MSTHHPLIVLLVLALVIIWLANLNARTGVTISQDDAGGGSAFVGLTPMNGLGV